MMEIGRAFLYNTVMKKFKSPFRRLGILLVLLLFPLIAAPGAFSAVSPQPERILGIFGGMGPEATANFYYLVVKSTPASKDQEHIPTLIFSFPQVPDRTTAIQSGDRSIVPYLVAGVRRLERAGASFIAIPCNTAHYFYDDMRKAVKIPIIHMIRETAEVVLRQHPGKKVIGLLATSGTIASGLYEKEFTARGCRVVIPTAEIQRDCVMKAIMGIKAGEEKSVGEELLARAAADVERQGAEVIVLGCTEIPLVFNAKRANVPVINATQVLADAAIRLYRNAR